MAHRPPTSASRAETREHLMLVLVGGQPGETKPVDTIASGPAPREAKPPRNKRPYVIIAGLVPSFSFFSLLGSALISVLGLPTNVLHYAGLVLLVLIGLGMIFARF